MAKNMFRRVNPKRRGFNTIVKSLISTAVGKINGLKKKPENLAHDAAEIFVKGGSVRAGIRSTCSFIAKYCKETAKWLHDQLTEAHTMWNQKLTKVKVVIVATEHIGTAVIVPA